MMRGIFGFIAIALLLLVGHAANASLIFEFSFDGSTTGGISGPIEGEIYGLVDGMTAAQSATSVVVTSIGGVPPILPTPFDMLGTGASANENSFVVENGLIIAWNFNAVIESIDGTVIVYTGLEFVGANDGLGTSAFGIGSSSDPDLIGCHQVGSSDCITFVAASGSDPYFTGCHQVGSSDCVTFAADASISGSQAGIEFTRREVPVPATVAIFGLGLAGLGMSGRKRNLQS